MLKLSPIILLATVAALSFSCSSHSEQTTKAENHSDEKSHQSLSAEQTLAIFNKGCPENPVEIFPQYAVGNNLRAIVSADPADADGDATLHLFIMNYQTGAPVDATNTKLSLQINNQNFTLSPETQEPGHYTFQLKLEKEAEAIPSSTFDVNGKAIAFTFSPLHIHFAEEPLAETASAHQGEEEGEGGEEHAHEAAAPATGAIVLSALQQQKVPVLTFPLFQSDFSAGIEAYGEVVATGTAQQTVVAPATGRVSYVKTLVPGMAVTKGQILATISGEGLTQSSVTVAAKEAQSRFEKAEADYLNAKKLVTDGAVSEKELRAYKAEYENAKATLEPYKGINNGKLKVLAPANGIISQIIPTEGEVIEAGSALLTIFNPSDVMLKVDLPQSYANSIGNIEKAQLLYQEKIVSTDSRLATTPVLNNDTRTFSLFFKLPAHAGLMPGITGKVFLLGKSEKKQLVIPTTAITEEQGVFLVYVQTAAEQFAKREVKITGENGSYLRIEGNIKPGEWVVTAGAIHLKLASMSGAIPAHSHNH